MPGELCNRSEAGIVKLPLEFSALTQKPCVEGITPSVLPL